MFRNIKCVDNTIKEKEKEKKKTTCQRNHKAGKNQESTEYYLETFSRMLTIDFVVAEYELDDNISYISKHKKIKLLDFVAF